MWLFHKKWKQTVKEMEVQMIYKHCKNAQVSVSPGSVSVLLEIILEAPVHRFFGGSFSDFL